MKKLSGIVWTLAVFAILVLTLPGMTFAQDDDFGPEWMLRLLFVPVLPAPAWSRTPLF